MNIFSQYGGFYLNGTVYSISCSDNLDEHSVRPGIDQLPVFGIEIEGSKPQMRESSVLKKEKIPDTPFKSSKPVVPLEQFIAPTPSVYAVSKIRIPNTEIEGGNNLFMGSPKPPVWSNSPGYNSQLHFGYIPKHGLDPLQSLVTVNPYSGINFTPFNSGFDNVTANGSNNPQQETNSHFGSQNPIDKKNPNKIAI